MTQAFPTENLSCKICQQPMSGIRSYDLRERCEACGGNRTEFTAQNPNPKKIGLPQ